MANYSQMIQDNPELVQQAQAQMQPQAAPITQAAPVAGPAGGQPQYPTPYTSGTGVAPVQQAPDANYAQMASQVAGTAGGNDNDGNTGMKDQSTIQDVMSIFKMFGGGG